MNDNLKHLKQLLNLAKHRADIEARKLQTCRKHHRQASFTLKTMKKQLHEFLLQKQITKDSLLDNLMAASTLKPREVLSYAEKVDQLDQEQLARNKQIEETVQKVETLRKKAQTQQSIFTKANAKITKLQELKNDTEQAVQKELEYKEDMEIEDTVAGLWSHRSTL